MGLTELLAIIGPCGVIGSGVIYAVSKFSARQRSRKAFLAATLEGEILEIYNTGESGAKNIQLFIDGTPYLDHRAWPKNGMEIRSVGPRSTLTRKIGFSLDCIPSHLSLKWESDHGVKGNWDSSI